MPKKVESRYASSPVGESPSSSSSSLEGEDRPSFIPWPNIKSYFNESSLMDFVKEHKLLDILYFIPTPHYRIGDPQVGGTSFYARVIEDGINLLLHPFFCDILSSYGIASDQLTPLAWCQMAGMLMMWGDLFWKTPSVAVWHHVYGLKVVRGKKGAYYVTKHHKGLDMFIEGLPNSYGDWRRRWFFLNLELCGPTL